MTDKNGFKKKDYTGETVWFRNKKREPAEIKKGWPDNPAGVLKVLQLPGSLHREDACFPQVSYREIL